MSSNSSTWIRALFSDSVFLATQNALRMKTVFLHVIGKNTHRKVDALIDTGATNNFMTPALAKELLLSPTPLPKACIIRNVDGTQNKGGHITEYVDLEVKTGQNDSPWFSMLGTQQ